MTILDDPKFAVQIIASTPNPNTVIWCAMHQDYSEHYVAEELLYRTYKVPIPDERKAGEIIVRKLLNTAHFGPLEHVSITFNLGYYVHDTIMQLRTHRVGISFDVQSQRYTGDRVMEVSKGTLDIEDVFYFRPEGIYIDREGNKYLYDKSRIDADKETTRILCDLYTDKVNNHGYSPEHARQLLPQNIRQHAIVSMNARTLLHILDLRAKKDAQIEIQDMSYRMFVAAKTWIPEICEWYEKNRLGKGRLAP